MIQSVVESLFIFLCLDESDSKREQLGKGPFLLLKADDTSLKEVEREVGDRGKPSRWN